MIVAGGGPRVGMHTSVPPSAYFAVITSCIGVLPMLPIMCERRCMGNAINTPRRWMIPACSLGSGFSRFG